MAGRQLRQRVVALSAVGVIFASTVLVVVGFIARGSDGGCIKDMRVAPSLMWLVRNYGDAVPPSLSNEEALIRILELDNEYHRKKLDEAGVVIAVNPAWDRQSETTVPAVVAYRRNERCRHWVDGRGVVTANRNPIPPGWIVVHDQE